MSENKNKNKGGRPTIYNDELAKKICDLFAQGYSQRQIAKMEDMPTDSTITNWILDKDKKEFLAQYAQAKAKCMDHFADEIVSIADDGANDYYEREGKDGETIKALDHEHVSRSRLRIDTRKWLMSKLKPKKYGDRLDLGNADGKPLAITVKSLKGMSDDELDSELEGMI